MSDRVDVHRCQRVLVTTWSIGALLTFFLMILQTIHPEAPLDGERGWAWLLSLVSPTLTLMWGAVFSDARARRTTVTVDRFAFRLSLGISIVFLFTVTLVLLLPPFLQLRADERGALLERSNLWLAPIQGLLGIAMGAFFVSREGGTTHRSLAPLRASTT